MGAITSSVAKISARRPTTLRSRIKSLSASVWNPESVLRFFDASPHPMNEYPFVCRSWSLNTYSVHEKLMMCSAIRSQEPDRGLWKTFRNYFGFTAEAGEVVRAIMASESSSSAVITSASRTHHQHRVTKGQIWGCVEGSNHMGASSRMTSANAEVTIYEVKIAPESRVYKFIGRERSASVSNPLNFNSKREYETTMHPGIKASSELLSAHQKMRILCASYRGLRQNIHGNMSNY
ncbi:hypothetical protein F5146DRAFT_995185 [Armillaria mellea]|nr:hypothetical protein F5146DRAFT_995185 [Armillaria mellea]